nr:histone deacetylase 5 [Tanacetum cinerariifolium]
MHIQLTLLEWFLFLHMGYVNTSLPNSVGGSKAFLLDQKELGINKILIVNLDAHHGNGTQKMFWKDPRVLFFSVHRHEHGNFYPRGDDGSHFMMGEGPGLGRILISAGFDVASSVCLSSRLTATLLRQKMEQSQLLTCL